MINEHSAGILVYSIQIIEKVPVRLYLLLYYPKGYWALVKGHLDPGETPLEAAHREVMEETGLTAIVDEGFVDVLRYIFTNKHGQKVAKEVTFYVGQAISTDVQLSHEHEAYAWLPFEEAYERLTYDNAKQLLKAAESFLEKK